MLLADGNRFITGGEPRESDVRNFLWYHSPHFCYPGSLFWRLRKWWALDRITTLCTQPWRQVVFAKPSFGWYAAIIAMASAEIMAICDEAFAESSRPKGRTSPPVACLEAQMIALFSEHFGWPMERTRRTPLKQLFQLERCVLKLNGAKIADDGFDALLVDFLQKANAPAIAAQKATVKSEKETA